jgi:gliding motility-associated-like protein
MRLVRFILLLLLAFPLFCHSQTTTNLILNNSFETVNQLSSLYDSAVGAAYVIDTSFTQSAIPCWASARTSTGFIDILPDSFPYFCNTCNPPPEDQNRTIWITCDIMDTLTSGVNPQVQTKLLHSLVAGSVYRLSGYINVFIWTDTEKIIRHPQTPFGQLKKLGFYFSNSRTYDTAIYMQNANRSVFFSITPTVEYTLQYADLPYGTNPWQRFDLTFTAHGGEQYLSIGNFDSTINNIYLMPLADSLFYSTLTDSSSSSISMAYYIDNLSLIPLADTAKMIINPYVANPDSILSQASKLLCQGSVMSIGTQASFYSYLWSTGDTTRSISIASPGTYTVTVDNGCAIYADTIQVLRDTTLQSGYTIADTLICTNSVLTYTLPDSFLADHINWSNGDTGLSATFSSGMHALSLSNQCLNYTDTFSIHYTGADTIRLFTDTSIANCAGQVYTIIPSGSYMAYMWSDGAVSQSITVSQSGYYSLTVTDLAGCKITGTVHDVAPTTPTRLFAQDTIRFCANQYPAVFAADSGFIQYFWNGSPGDNYYLIDSPNTIVYVQGTTPCGTVSDTLLALAIQEPTGLSYTIDSDCTENTATIHLSAMGSPVLNWNNGNSSTQITTSLPQLLIVDAKYTCTVISDTINIPGCALFTHHIYIPNAFTPNGDGSNDFFEMYGDKINWRNLAVSIWDRWGEKVFESDDINFKWDGRYKGAIETGLYIYTISVTYTDGRGQNFKGSITLIR